MHRKIHYLRPQISAAVSFGHMASNAVVTHRRQYRILTVTENLTVKVSFV